MPIDAAWHLQSFPRSRQAAAFRLHAPDAQHSIRYRRAQAQPVCAMGLASAPERTRSALSFASPTPDAPPALPAPRTPDADERWRRGFRTGSSRAASSSSAAGEQTGSPLRRAASAGVHAAYTVDISLVSPAFQVSPALWTQGSRQHAPIAYSPRPAACQALLPALSCEADTSAQLVGSCCQRLGVVRVPTLCVGRAGPARVVPSVVGALTTRRPCAPRRPTTWRSSSCARCLPARRRRPACASPWRCAPRRSLSRPLRRSSTSALQHTQRPRTRRCSCRRRARSCSASARRGCRLRCAHSRRTKVSWHAHLTFSHPGCLRRHALPGRAAARSAAGAAAAGRRGRRRRCARQPGQPAASQHAAHVRGRGVGRGCAGRARRLRACARARAVPLHARLDQACSASIDDG